MLHNFVRDRDGYEFNDTMVIRGWEDSDLTDEPMIRGGAMGIRNKLADYFLTDAGTLSWQMSIR